MDQTRVAEATSDKTTMIETSALSEPAKTPETPKTNAAKTIAIDVTMAKTVTVQIPTAVT